MYGPPLKEMQAGLKKSRIAQNYLKTRAIPLDLAIQCGAGYAPYGSWPHYNEKGKPVRQWRPGRVVFPVRNENYELINLYGRAVSFDCPKTVRHDFLPGPKGGFNPEALKCESVFVVEGIMDALSLMALGKPNVIAIFGVHGLNWDLVQAKSCGKKEQRRDCQVYRDLA